MLGLFHMQVEQIGGGGGGAKYTEHPRPERSGQKSLYVNNSLGFHIL